MWSAKLLAAAALAGKAFDEPRPDYKPGDEATPGPNGSRPIRDRMHRLDMPLAPG